MIEEVGRRRYQTKLSELVEKGLPYEAIQQLTAPPVGGVRWGGIGGDMWWLVWRARVCCPARPSSS